MKMNREFYDELFYYLTDAEARLQYYRALARERRLNKSDSPRQGTEHALYELLRHPEQREYNEVMSELTELLIGADLLSQIRYEQYRIIEEELQRYPCLSLADILRFLDRICERNRMTDPAYGILFDHYGEIIRALFNSHDPEDYFVDDPLNEGQLLCLLSDFIIKELKPEQIMFHAPGEDPVISDSDLHAFGESVSEEHAEDDDEEFEFEYTGDDNELLQDFIITVSDHELEYYITKQDTIYISPTLFKDDEVYIEDLVTFVNSDRSSGVTFRIIGEGCLNSADFNLLFESIKDQLGGCKDGDTVEETFDSSHSYKVLRLPFPILRAEDIDLYK